MIAVAEQNQSQPKEETKKERKRLMMMTINPIHHHNSILLLGPRKRRKKFQSHLKCLNSKRKKETMMMDWQFNHQIGASVSNMMVKPNIHLMRLRVTTLRDYRKSASKYLARSSVTKCS